MIELLLITVVIGYIVSYIVMLGSRDDLPNFMYDLDSTDYFYDIYTCAPDNKCKCELCTISDKESRL